MQNEQNDKTALMKSIHHYWFGDLTTAMPKQEIMDKWFKYSLQVDAEINERYTPVLEGASRGEYADWRNNGQGCLVLVLLFDQFPRHIYRGDAQAFAYGEQAIEVAEHICQQKYDVDMHPVERTFCYLPFEHSEDIKLQEKAVLLYKRMTASTSADQFEFARLGHTMAREHHQVIDRFGRFPHRNEVLGRQSTEEEITFLAEERKNYIWMG